jgi:hypothetical protein
MKKNATAIKTICKSVTEGLLHVVRTANAYNTPLNRLIIQYIYKCLADPGQRLDLCM